MPPKCTAVVMKAQKVYSQTDGKCTGGSNDVQRVKTQSDIECTDDGDDVQIMCSQSVENADNVKDEKSVHERFDDMRLMKKTSSGQKKMRKKRV